MESCLIGSLSTLYFERREAPNESHVWKTFTLATEEPSPITVFPVMAWMASGIYLFMMLTLSSLKLQMSCTPI